MIGRVCHLLRMQAPVVDNRGLLYLSGATVPTDNTDGYQTGCLFQHTDGTSGTALYINEGTVAACDFNPVDAGGITTSIDVGTFSSLESGDGIAISSDDRSAVAIFGDDNGLAIASSVYNLRTRLLLTVDQDGASIRALMAQLKLCDGVDVSTGIYTASQGYLELAGDTSAETGATLSCFDASLEVASGNTLTVDSGGEVAGLHVETTGAGTITNNGTCAGILIKNASGAPDWPIGVLVDGPSVSCGISVGAYASSQALGSAVRMSATTHTAAAAVFGETAVALGYGYMTRAVRGRHLVNKSGNINQETYGVQGQLVVTGATLQHLHAGVLGTIEAASSVTLANGLGYTYAHAGVMSRVGGLAAQITATTPLCGFLAFLNDQAGAGLAGATTCVAYAAYANSTWTTTWDIGFVTDGCAIGLQVGACTTAINVAGQAATRILDYTTVTAIDEPGAGHLIRYGASGAPIQWTPTATCNGTQMYITSTGPAGGGFALVGARVHVTLTGTTKITANAGNFWTKIDCDDYTGDYVGGHPTGLSGIIECAGTLRQAATVHAVMAGVCGEVRPVTTSSTTNMGGVICGLHAKIFATSAQVDTGDVVGVLVQTMSSSAADIGVLVRPHTGATWTTGIKLDAADPYGTIGRGITFTGIFTNEAILVGASGTPLVYPLSATQNTCVSIYADLTDPGTDKFFRGLYVRTRYMPSDTEGGASVYGIRGHVLTVATYDNVGVDENICGVHGYVTGTADALLNQAGITVAGLRGELGGSGASWDVKIACAIEAKACLTALPSSTVNAYCGVSVYAPTSDATPLDCAIYCWGWIQGGIDFRGCAGDSLDWVFAVSANDAAVSASEGAVGTHGGASRKIVIKVDGNDYYLLVSTVPTFA